MYVCVYMYDCIKYCCVPAVDYNWSHVTVSHVGRVNSSEEVQYGRGLGGNILSGQAV